MFRSYGKESCCVMTDGLRSAYHCIGLAEYRLVRYFDGKTLFSEAVARAAMETGADALSENEAISVLVWMVDNELVDLGGVIPVDILRKAGGQRILSRMGQMMNVLSIRVPLGNPNRFFQSIAGSLRFFGGPLFFVIWLVTVFAGLLQVVMNMDRLRSGTEGILSPDNWLLLLIVWVFIKVCHEFMHGLIVVLLGGEASEVGILFILFMPLGYVDATSSLAFHSKWKRMFVAAAGMYGELFLAAIAALVWAWTDQGLINTLALNAMITASIVTLMFNLNPLMRFDGYHILVDWLEMPNLSTRSMRLLSELARTWLFGNAESDLPDFRQRTTWIYLLYGIAALVWRILIITTLLVAASLFLQGGGLVFAVIAACWIFIPMLLKVWSFFARELRMQTIRLRELLLRCGGIVAVVLFVMFMPYRVRYVTHGVFRYADEHIYRAEIAGFVSSVHVDVNQHVQAGDRLLEMENPELEARLHMLKQSLARQDLVWRMAHLNDKPVTARAEAMARAALETQVQELERSLYTLQFKALQDGKVLTPLLSSFPGRYFQRGEEVVRVADPTRGEIVIPVAIADVEDFQKHVGLPVAVRADGRFRSRRGYIHSIGSRAVRSTDYPELTAVAGGKLAVRPVKSNTGDAAYELVDPVFWGRVALTHDARVWQPGERVRVAFRSKQTTRLSQRITNRVERFLRHVLVRARARVER